MPRQGKFFLSTCTDRNLCVGYTAKPKVSSPRKYKPRSSLSKSLIESPLKPIPKLKLRLKFNSIHAPQNLLSIIFGTTVPLFLSPIRHDVTSTSEFGFAPKELYFADRKLGVRNLGPIVSSTSRHTTSILSPLPSSPVPFQLRTLTLNTTLPPKNYPHLICKVFTDLFASYNPEKSSSFSNASRNVRFEFPVKELGVIRDKLLLELDLKNGKLSLYS